MKPEEKAALDWLDLEYRWVGDSHPARTLKAMLAAPRLPEEPTNDALYAMRDATSSGLVEMKRAYRALYAHLTKPAIKTVEVWHVEYATGSVPHVDDPYMRREDAERAADVRRATVGYSCIHVTGPHLQEVPA